MLQVPGLLSNIDIRIVFEVDILKIAWRGETKMYVVIKMSE